MTPAAPAAASVQPLLCPVRLGSATTRSNGNGFEVQTLTGTQAARELVPTTLAATYAADLAADNGRHDARQFTVGSAKLFIIPESDWVAETLIPSTNRPATAGAEYAAAASSCGSCHGVLLTERNAYTFTVPDPDCVAQIYATLLSRYGRVPTEAERATAEKQAKEFCK